MQQIADWLEKLGMSEYVQRFAENGITAEALRHLTDQDLKDIGVLLGHRRIILAAIGELASVASATPKADANVTAASAPTSAAPSIAAASAAPVMEAVGERRHVTVMFCDLVGSTGIAAKLDAEEWRDLVGAYLDAASAAVTEMGGKVAKKLGDGLMALFGHPVAQENDAERAARAALSIQRALAELNRKNVGSGKPVLAARIAIESGPVVVDATGEIFGDVPNIAARAQALAEPGAVVVTARVQRQIAGLFVAEERGSHELKGVPEPVTLFRIIRASGGGRRAAQRHLTPLVGRDEEIDMLLRRWERVRQGDGQLVMIVGEPGLGKSRLIEEFHARLRDVTHTWVEWSCSQLLQNTPLHPIAETGRQRFGGADVPAERRLAELDSSLAQVKLDPAENAPLLAPLLDIPLPQERASTFAPEELRRRQLAALTGVSTDLGRAVAPRDNFAGAAGPRAGAADGWRAYRSKCVERGEQGTLLAIPPTLQQSLTARLDRLGSAREVAQRYSDTGARPWTSRISASALRCRLKRRIFNGGDGANKRVGEVATDDGTDSSMRLYRMPLMRICLRAADKRYIVASERLC